MTKLKNEVTPREHYVKQEGDKYYVIAVEKSYEQKWDEEYEEWEDDYTKPKFERVKIAEVFGKTPEEARANAKLFSEAHGTLLFYELAIEMLGDYVNSKVNPNDNRVQQFTRTEFYNSCVRFLEEQTNNMNYLKVEKSE